MPVFLETDDIFAKLNNLIDEAQKFICLVSPYITFNSTQILKIKKAAEEGVPVTIVYRKDARNKDTEIELSKLADTPSIRVIGCPNLHAKIYANERNAILTSRNIWDRQKGCSIEVGVLFKRYEPIYDELLSTAEDLIELDDATPFIDNRKKQKGMEIITGRGYCIRCGRQIPYNLTQTYCPNCKDKWQKSGGYEKTREKYCHRCGQWGDYITSVHSLCYYCYNQTKR